MDNDNIVKILIYDHDHERENSNFLPFYNFFLFSYYIKFKNNEHYLRGRKLRK